VREDIRGLGEAAVANGGGDEIGLVLTGGGARGAYQVGVLRWITRRYPELRIPIVTGVSAGALNAAKLAAHHGTVAQAVEELSALWERLTTEDIFHVDAARLAWNSLRWAGQLVSGGAIDAPRVRGLLNTSPLRSLLEEVLPNVAGELAGIKYNLHRGSLRALAIMTTSYSTGQSVTWVEGRGIRPWRRPARKAVQTHIMIDHIMASAALPLFFPAVRIGDGWYGDGGIRLVAPLSPALHLGASRLLAISTRYERTRGEQDVSDIVGYPPPAQVIGVLLNSVFLDLIDQDVFRLERLNDLIEELPEEQRHGMRSIRLLVMRPSRDLATLAAGYERQLPRAFRFLVRGLGTSQTRSPDVLSMLGFVPDYLSTMMEIGEADADRRSDEIDAFLEEREEPAAAGH
jgi:NTE family protein